MVHEQDHVREPADNHPPDPPFDPKMRLRSALRRCKRDFYTAEELVPEPLAPPLVPVPRLIELGGGLRTDPKRKAHRRCRTCSRAVSQGMDASGCAS